MRNAKRIFETSIFEHPHLFNGHYRIRNTFPTRHFCVIPSRLGLLYPPVEVCNILYRNFARIPRGSVKLFSDRKFYCIKDVKQMLSKSKSGFIYLFLNSGRKSTFLRCGTAIINFTIA